MLVDFFCRKVLLRGLPRTRYLTLARFWAMFSILIAALSTHWIENIKAYVDLTLSLLCFLGIPIYFGVVWRRSNRTGTWLSLLCGIGSFLVVFFVLPQGDGHWLADQHARFVASVFISTASSLLGMLVGTWLGRGERDTLLDRFYVIMNTPIGQKARLVAAGIRLPSLIDAELVEEGEESLDHAMLRQLYRADAEQKIFGPTSAMEIRRERLGWYLAGFLQVTACCALLVLATWLATRVLFVWKWL